MALGGRVLGWASRGVQCSPLLPHCLPQQPALTGTCTSATKTSVPVSTETASLVAEDAISQQKIEDNTQLPGQLQQPPSQQQLTPGYVPLPSGPPATARRSADGHPAANKGGATAAARRLRASRAGRISTANYRPLPASTATGVQTEYLSTRLGSDQNNGGRLPQLQQVRFGDVLGLHWNDRQLIATIPAKKPQSRTCNTCPRWEMVSAYATDGVECGKFEVHPSWEWSKQRTFSGAVRQVLGHRSVMGVESSAEILNAVDSLPPGRVSPKTRDVLERKLRFAQAEARANSVQSTVALLEHTCVENGCKVQLKHVQTGRWLACCVDATRRAAVTSGVIAARKVMQLRSDGDESCWWVLCGSGVGVSGMLNYDGRTSVYLSPAAATLTHTMPPKSIVVGPPSVAVQDRELELCVAAVRSCERTVVAETAVAAVAADSYGWKLRPYSRVTTPTSGPSAMAPADIGSPAFESMGTPVPAFPPELRKERILEYDATRYPFKEVLAKILHSDLVANGRVDGETTVNGSALGDGKLAKAPYDQYDLGTLHTSLLGRNFVLRDPNVNVRNPYDRRYKAMDRHLRMEYLELYTRFLREVVWPALGSDPQGLVYQAVPTFRCHLPGTGRPLIRKHNDAEYFHQPNEINVWLPITKTFGSNTLWSESVPGRGDFHPFECEGDHKTKRQCILFWGNACYHYTLPNDTNTTRVSVDFRVIPRAYYQTIYKDCLRVDGQPRFSLGAYYQETGPISTDVAESAD